MPLDQHLIEKLPRPGRERILEDLAGRAVLDHCASASITARSARPRKPILVRHHNQRQPVAFQVLQDNQHLIFQLRSKALVISSHNRPRGSMAIARAIATRCFWPPESSAG